MPDDPAAPTATASASDDAIRINGLVKRYGRVTALDGVTLTVPRGSVFGFLGPNGAGKTTTLRILTGLAKPTAGTARILGHDVVGATNEVRRLIGFLPDVPGFYSWMTAEEFLRFTGRVFAIDRATLDRRIAVLLELAGLTGVKTRISGFSRGMKQRLGVAQALVNAPELLMLDEPTSALDPIGRKEVLDMIASLGGRTTVFFSTHILADVERVCDTVAILDRGRVVAQAPIAELRARSSSATALILQIAEDPTPLAEALQALPWTRDLTREGTTLRVTVTDLPEAQRTVPALIAERALSLIRLETAEPSLEDVFVQLVGGERM